jgi:hypothetical protein
MSAVSMSGRRASTTATSRSRNGCAPRAEATMRYLAVAKAPVGGGSGDCAGRSRRPGGETSDAIGRLDWLQVLW